MASGKKEMVINTQERAVSTDINRLQKFANFCDAELWRWLVDVSIQDETQGGGGWVEHTTLTSPIRAEVIGGLTVVPAMGNTTITIQGGVMWAVVPDGAPDDSVYKFVQSPGDQSGSLSVAANPSGQIRIDVIECALSDSVVETDNRDIFNPLTQLFTPTTVTKARQDTLTFRVRQGTAGGGWPGFAAGWIPLAVASVPPSSVNNDACIFWDVRNQVSDRQRGPYRHSEGSHRQNHPDNDFHIAATTLAATGTAKFWFNGLLAGGYFPIGADAFDFVNNDTVDPGNFPLSVTGMYGIWLMQPFKLPWRRYTSAAHGSRVPGPFCGIPVGSYSKQVDSSGAPNIAISTPAYLGLVITTSTDCFLMFAGQQFATIVPGGHCRGDFYSAPTGIYQSSGGVTGHVFNQNDSDGAYPAGARELHVAINLIGTSQTNMTQTIASHIELDVTPGDFTPYDDVYQFTFIQPGNSAISNLNIEWVTTIPFTFDYPNGSGPHARTWTVTASALTSIFTGTITVSIVFLGYKL